MRLIENMVRFFSVFIKPEISRDYFNIVRVKQTMYFVFTFTIQHVLFLSPFQNTVMLKSFKMKLWSLGHYEIAQLEVDLLEERRQMLTKDTKKTVMLFQVLWSLFEKRTSHFGRASFFFFLRNTCCFDQSCNFFSLKKYHFFKNNIK